MEHDKKDNKSKASHDAQGLQNTIKEANGVNTVVDIVYDLGDYTYNEWQNIKRRSVKCAQCEYIALDISIMKKHKLLILEKISLCVLHVNLNQPCTFRKVWAMWEIFLNYTIFKYHK